LQLLLELLRDVDHVDRDLRQDPLDVEPLLLQVLLHRALHVNQ
jgi:hypothetical protein